MKKTTVLLILAGVLGLHLLTDAPPETNCDSRSIGRTLICQTK